MRPCLVLTRPQASSETFAEMARMAGWQGEVVIAPLIEIALISPPPDILQRARVLIFTSQHAVAAMAQHENARHWPVWAVGPRTAEAARASGFSEVHQAGGDAKALLSDLDAAGETGPFLHLRGDHVAADIVSALRSRGHAAQGVVVYSQQARSLSAAAKTRIMQGGDLVLAVFSPRSAALLVSELAALRTGEATRLHLVAISPAAAEAARVLGPASTSIAVTPDASGMLTALAATQAMLEPLEKPS